MATELSGTVTTIQRFSLDDGPGIRTTVFLKGCQLTCPWCHNPEGLSKLPEIYFRSAKCIGCGKCAEVCPVESCIKLDSEERIDRKLCILCMKCTQVCPSGALEEVGKTMTVSEVIDEVMRDLLFYEISGGGVTFSGGEPTTQALYLAALLERAKIMGLHTCIETNGCAGSKVWDRILPNIDLVLLDIKHLDPVVHKKFTGVDNELVLTSAREIASRVETILRTPIIPGFNDSEDFIEQLGQFASGLSNIKECHLIPYHDYGSSKYVMLGRKEDIYCVRESLGNRPQHYKKILEKYGLKVKVL